MKQADNIITIRRADISKANEAFAYLMAKSESILNDNAEKLKKISATDLEAVSVDFIQRACNDTPFRPEEVKLISGHKFPDICLEQFYGVEVKSTIKDKWTSTGSSIVESTRIKDVDLIYMLFGKLGGDMPQFRIRPYADILSDIAVTHSPRYLIDMTLESGKSIFDKMGTTYDEFRTSKDMITKVRTYHKAIAQKNGKSEMPWWISPEETERTTSFNIRLWSDLSIQEKNYIQAMAMILFPEAITPRPSTIKYNNLSLWLCSYYQVINHSIRDIFSAGGQINYVNGEKLPKPIPKIFKNIIDLSPIVEEILNEKSLDTQHLINEFNDSLLKSPLSLYEAWINQCAVMANANNVKHFEEWLRNRYTLE